MAEQQTFNLEEFTKDFYEEFTEIQVRPTDTVKEGDMAAATACGQQRRLNEDACALLHRHHAHPGNENIALPSIDLMIVADGVGGIPGGEYASAIAVHTMTDHLGSFWEFFGNGLDTPTSLAPSLLGRAVLNADREVMVRRAASNIPRLFNMATGICAAMVICDRSGHAILHTAHSGDVRAYIHHDGDLRKVTTDHSFLEMAERRSGVALDDTSEARKHMITQALGANCDPDYGSHAIEDGDRVLVCSDGLWGYVEEKKIADLLGQADTAESAVDDLIEAALACDGGPDNITAAVHIWNSPIG